MTRTGFGERWYRGLVRPPALVTFSVRVKETDLHLWAQRDLSERALEVVLANRRALERFLGENPGVERALTPLSHRAGEPPVWSRMVDATAKAGVGPMAAVAGVFADLVGEALEPLSGEVMVENGGDIFLRSSEPRRVAILGDGTSGRPAMTVEIAPGRWGVCTSSATVGPSLSFGSASAVTILASTACLADAFATRYCNLTGRAGVAEVLSAASRDPDVLGIAVVSGGGCGFAGALRLAV